MRIGEKAEQNVFMVSEGIMDRESMPFEDDVRFVRYRKDVTYGREVFEDMSKRFTYPLNALGGKRFLVVGCGSLGNEVVKDLVYSGISDLTVVDMDLVEYHNLPRSSMFRMEDNGHSKSLTMAKRAAEASPFDISTCGIHADITRMGLGFFEGFDIVMSPVDCWSIRNFVSMCCHQLGKTHISCGTSVLTEKKIMATTVTVEPAGCDACYGCMVPGNLSAEEKKLSCISYSPETQPQVMPFSSVSAGMAVQMAIDCVLGRFHPDKKDDDGRPLAWSYTINEAGILGDSKGISTCRCWNRRHGCINHDFLSLPELDEVVTSRKDGVAGFWEKVPEEFRGNGAFTVDLRSSGLYYLAFPYHGNGSECAPPAGTMFVYDPEYHEDDDLVFSRLPPDHLYLISVPTIEGEDRCAKVRVRLV